MKKSSNLNYVAAGLLLQALLGMSLESYSQISFTQHELNGTFPRTGEIVTGDLDGDGDLDFIATGYHRDNDPTMGTYLYFNDGEGNFTMVEDHGIQNLSYTGLALGDVDSDQDLDMIITGQVNAPELVLSVKMYFNNGDGSFTEAESTPFPATYYSEVEFFDFNGDSNLDVLYTGGIHFSSQLAKIFLGDGNGNFTELEDTGLYPSWYSAIALGDVDLDGDEDLVLSSRSQSSGQGTYVYLRDGNRYYRQSRPINYLVDGEIRLADFDEDGDLDLIVTGNTIYDSRMVSVEYFTNDGNGTFVKEIKEGIVGASRDANLQVKDFDYDGDLDVFIGGVNQIIDANNFYFNDGNANFTPNNFKFPNNRFGGTAVGDFNGKGYDDVIIFYANITTGNRNMIFLNSDDLNKPPSVSEIQISGKTFVGEELGVTYAYSDPNGDEDQSVLQWFRADNVEGEGKMNIEGANNATYVADELDEGKFLGLEITPNDGEKNGEPVLSNWIGPIQIALPSIYVTGNNFPIINGSSDSSPENHTDFGETVYNNGVERIFTIENTGDADLSIMEITLTGTEPADFSITQPEINTLPPAGRVNFAVSFEPKGVGKRSREINILNSDETNNPFNFTISGVSLNLPPVFSSADQVEWEENSEGIVIDVDANDGEGGSIDAGTTYSITGGEDAALFKIDGQTGQLSFLQLPDFEKPEDMNVDNFYSVEVTANDGEETNSSSTQLIVISVLNVDEPPIAMCLDNLTIILDETGVARIEAEDIDLGSNDDLGIANLSIEPSSWTCNELGTQIVTLTVTDSNGAKAVCTSSVTIVDNQVPIIVEKESLEQENDPGEGGALVNVPVPEVLDNCDDGIIITGNRADGLSLDAFFPLGETIITWTAEDASGNKAEPMFQSVNIIDSEKPIIHPPVNIFQNSEEGMCGAYVEIIPPVVSDNSDGPIKITGTRADHDLKDKFDVGTTYITWIATDAAGNNSTPVVQEVFINSIVPKDIVISGPAGPKRIDEEIPIVASFSDDNIAKGTWKIMNGDKVVQEDSFLPENSSISKTVSDLQAGVYTVTLELIDHCGNKNIGYSDYVVVYDPNGGFVTGGGWINSPSGALRNSDVAGKAHFGFNAKYKNGNNDVDEVGGETSFQFKTGNLNFKSVSHEAMSLVVAGGFKATYKGTGTINGEGNFKFMVTVIDAEETVNYSHDLFRIRISEGGTVIYDNNLAVEAEDADPITSIGGGSIVIHKPKAQGKSSQLALDLDLQPTVSEIFTAYPNPMGEKTMVQVVLPKTTTGILNLFDLNGREVLKIYEGRFEPGETYEFEMNRNYLMEGIYIIRLKTENNNYQKQLIID